MAKKKISPKVQEATEKYLTSLGSSKEQLTEKQWEIVTNYVKSRRVAKLTITFFLIAGIFNAGLCYWAFHLGKHAINSMIPSETAQVTYVSKNGEKSIPLTPASITDYMKAAANLYWSAGSSFVLAVFFFSWFIIAPLLRRSNRKMLEAFIPHITEEPKATTPDK